MHKGGLQKIGGAAITFLITIAMIALPSVPAHGQVQWTVLVIHGRTDPNQVPCGQKESYGVFDSDKNCIWDVPGPVTVGKVKYVYWDAWNHSFDDPIWPGGEAVVHAAVFGNCNVNTNHSCSVM